MLVTTQYTETKNIVVDLQSILKEAHSNLVGKGNYIKSGSVYHFDTQYTNKPVFIRKATMKEIELEKAMLELIHLLED